MYEVNFILFVRLSSNLLQWLNQRLFYSPKPRFYRHKLVSDLDVTIKFVFLALMFLHMGKLSLEFVHD